MRTTVGKLRVTLVALLVLVLVGVSAFVLYGRHLARRFALALPKQLAKGLLQESFHVSFSHSEHGKTVFTVHAAKEQKWTSGLIVLDDVGIELYGRQDGAPDRIHGSKFEFDQAKGLLTAIGDVYIDLAAPPGHDGQQDGAKSLHLKTSGLVFNQKTRNAATDAEIEFQAAGMTGTAMGADYDAERQFIVLRRAVRVSGLRDGRPVLLTATHAEIDRKADVADLAEAKYTSAEESVSADRAHLLLTDSGAVRGVEAQGRVSLASGGHGTLYGDRLHAALSDAGKVHEAHLWGAVRYLDDANGRSVQGQARDLQVGFSGAGLPEHAVMTGAVSLATRSATAARSVHADLLDAVLTDAGKGRVALREATASGSAVLDTTSSGAKGRTSDQVRGDVLKAEFAGSGAAARILTLDGAGHTVVDQVSLNGVEQRSTGDTLAVSFTGVGHDTAVAHAVQAGSFRSVRTVPGKAPSGTKPKQPTVERAQAAQATYEARLDQLVLTGTVQLAEAADLLQADTVSLDRVSGDAQADGNVRATYAREPDAGGKASEPVHILAARALEHRAAGTADFLGPAGGGDARMWQGGSQVSAPVLSFHQSSKTLEAHGVSTAGDADAVRALLVGDTAPKPGSRATGPVRVLSHAMVYHDNTREVVFSGRVRVDGQDGTLTAQDATAYLAPVQATGSSKAEPGGGIFPAGQVERIVANGGVRVVDGERHAQGTQLLYTAADRTFVLTGTATDRPSMTDEAQGTITGRTLRFRSGDSSVQVVGGEGDAGRVRSDLRVKQR